MLSNHTVGFKRPDNSNLANLTPGLCILVGLGMTDDILTLKAIRRKHELIWRKTRTKINFDIYYDSCKAVKEAISNRKSELMEQRVIDCAGDQKNMFSPIHSLLGSK